MFVVLYRRALGSYSTAYTAATAPWAGTPGGRLARHRLGVFDPWPHERARRDAQDEVHAMNPGRLPRRVLHPF